jgi:hypothetical protein
MSEEYWQRRHEFWEAHYQRKLAGPEVREIMENLIGFFTVLDEWAREDERKKKAAEEKRQNTGPKPLRYRNTSGGGGGYGWISFCAA